MDDAFKPVVLMPTSISFFLIGVDATFIQTWVEVGGLGNGGMAQISCPCLDQSSVLAQQARMQSATGHMQLSAAVRYDASCTHCAEQEVATTGK